MLRRTASRLDQALAGRVVVRSDLRWPDVAGADLTGRVVLGTVAYGKHLLTRFDDARTLHTHLRMDGSWSIARTGTPRAAARGADVRAVLANEAWTAVGTRLGMVDLVPTRDEHRLIGHLGPDILADDFEPAGLERVLATLGTMPTVRICDALLDQRVVAGIGTIYTAESLFALRQWPWAPVGTVTEIAAVLLAARTLMQRSVALPWDGRAGGASERAVHARLRKPCRRCGTPIAVAQARRPPMERPIFYCPSCQAPRGQAGPAAT